MKSEYRIRIQITDTVDIYINISDKEFDELRDSIKYDLVKRLGCRRVEIHDVISEEALKGFDIAVKVFEQ